MPDTPPSRRRTREVLPRTSILRKRSDFERTKSKGRRVTGTCLVLNWLSVPELGRKFAVIVPKAVGNAVRRNLLKRRVREIYRRMQMALPEDLWSIWIVRRGADEVAFPDLKGEMVKLYQKARLLDVDGMSH